MSEHKDQPKRQGCSQEELTRLRKLFERPDPPKRRRHRLERQGAAN